MVITTRSRPKALGPKIALVLLGLVLLSSILSAESAISCQTTADCHNAQRSSGSSICKDGFCTNPFHGGCLEVMMNQQHANGADTLPFLQHSHTQLRVCNSNDDPLGNRLSKNKLCREPSFQYEEVRIAPGDWESAVLISWIYQIILSEVLHVPTVLEFGLEGPSEFQTSQAGSFYDEFNRFEYSSIAYPFEYLKEASKLEGDCIAAEKPCAHIMPEVWSGASKQLGEALETGCVLPNENNGLVGGLGFYLPLFTVERDWTLTSYHGLQDREKLADRFKTPTTFADYCVHVSKDNCTSSDDYVERPPSEDEKENYFVEEIYKGYFRTTPANNCTENPNTCTGHFVNPPCSWSTYAEAQFHWNDIPLASAGPLEPNNGYSYGHMTEIIKAANATKSDVFFWWWTPDQMLQEFESSPSEFYRVSLSRPTEDCIDYRSTSMDKCSPDRADRIGKAIGACDYQVGALKKVISTGLKISTYKSQYVERSPALDFLSRIKVPELAIDEIFRKWLDLGVDKMGYDGREAVCKWVYDNIEEFDRYIPHAYPRVLEDEEFLPSLRNAAIVIGSLALATLGITAHLTWRWRKEQVLKYAQVDVLVWYINGRTAATIGALVVAINVSNASCLVKEWGMMFGITMELVPLLIKISAINNLTAQAMRFRRAQVNPKRLKGALFSVLVIVVLYLTIWSAIDAPKKHVVYGESLLYDLSHIQRTGHENVIVHRQFECNSSSQFWKFVMFAWEFGLLLSATVLAVQSRDVIAELNESKYITWVIYVHFTFLIIRLAMFVSLQSHGITPNTYSGSVSIFLSIDTLCAVAIYFGPKFYEIVYEQPVTLPPPDLRTSLRPKSRPTLRSSNLAQGAKQSFRRRNIAGLNLDPEVCERGLIRRLSVAARNIKLKLHSRSSIYENSNDKLDAGEIEARDMEDGEVTPLKDEDNESNQKQVASQTTSSTDDTFDQLGSTRNINVKGTESEDVCVCPGSIDTDDILNPLLKGEEYGEEKREKSHGEENG